MFTFGRHTLGRRYLHKRYFVLESKVLAYYKRKPAENDVPTKSMMLDSDCTVQDKGIEQHTGHAVYVITVMNRSDRSKRMSMGALNVEEISDWLTALQNVIHSQVMLMQVLQEAGAKRRPAASLDGGFSNQDSGAHNRTDSSSNDSDNSTMVAPSSQIDSYHQNGGLKSRSARRAESIGQGLTDKVRDWGNAEPQTSRRILSRETGNPHRRRRLLGVENGLRFFEEINDSEHSNSNPAMTAIGVVEASCEAIFELVRAMDDSRLQWDCTFKSGVIVAHVDGHTDVVHKCLLQDWFPSFVWPRDLYYLRYWRRNEDGTFVILYRSTEDERCPPQPGYVRAHLESGGYIISPLKPRVCPGGETSPRSRVEHLLQINFKGWGVGYFSAFRRHHIMKMLSRIAGMRELFAEQSEEQVRRLGMAGRSQSAATTTGMSCHFPTRELPPLAGRMRDDSSDDMSQPQHPGSDSHRGDCLDDSESEEEDANGDSGRFYNPECPSEMDEMPEPLEDISMPMPPLDSGDTGSGPYDEDEDEYGPPVGPSSEFRGSLPHGDLENGKSCWSEPHGKQFRVRSKNYLVDNSKVRSKSQLGSTFKHRVLAVAVKRLGSCGSCGQGRRLECVSTEEA
ncbi:hypothetical protein CBR_g44571 [Chara braunii]|uniref:PH domain-containing protein n=1 Tax=Chara braunii TaxID=69332 RepID=A0A388LXW5_CHABU|nr:hypothetical protein CBR_g44571 [Chara braunii]|eukprot:GBG87115.1 hypothetical protein CBR_g44571 [Chara braunii]